MTAAEAAASVMAGSTRLPDPARCPRGEPAHVHGEHVDQEQTEEERRRADPGDGQTVLM